MIELFGFKTLFAYQRAITLVKDVYNLLKKYPSEEKYAICDQLRRAVVSVPSNIAEGMSRKSNKEVYHFLEIAMGSLMEVDSQLEVSKMLDYISEEEFAGMEKQISEVAKPLVGLMNKYSQQ